MSTYTTSDRRQPVTPVQMIHAATPRWLLDAPAARHAELQGALRRVPAWLRRASPALRRAVARAWRSQNQVDRMLEAVRDLRVFARAQLQAELSKVCNCTLDVERTWLRLYRPVQHGTGFTTRTLSMLDAALMNFDVRETRDGYFDAASCFVSPPSSDGRLRILPAPPGLSVQTFAQLCRRLDIGQRFQDLLAAILTPADDALRRRRLQQCIESQQDAWAAAAHLALVKGDIDRTAFDWLLALVKTSESLCFEGQAVRVYRLSLLGTPLCGPLLIAPDLDRADAVVRVILYLPHDPRHPMKTYPSTTALAQELAGRLRTPDFRRYFSQFLPHDQRVVFFSRLAEALGRLRWHPFVSGDPRPAWREEALANPNLRLRCHKLNGDFWRAVSTGKLEKIFSDSRLIAIPTADKDRDSRWAQWERLQGIADTVLGVVALVAAPFVPLLGEAMLACSVYQLLDGVFTGILDWTEGQLVEACDQLVAVAQSLVQLGSFALAGAVAVRLLPELTTPFLRGLRPVELPNGRRRLWHPDLTPYVHRPGLPPGSQPDGLGLHAHAGRLLLPLDGQVYQVRRSAGGLAITHPERADAYRPRLVLDTAGAWRQASLEPPTEAGPALGTGTTPAAPAADVVSRVKALYPDFSAEEMTRFITRRVQDQPPATLEHLEAEHAALCRSLDSWTAQVPERDPLSDTRLSEEQVQLQRACRQRFSDELRACWGQQATLDNPADPERFYFNADQLGTLPQLAADFSHVHEFWLVSEGSALGAGRFFEAFPRLKYLRLEGVRLEGLPMALFQLRDLVVLELEGCNLSLTAATAEGLAHMERLEVLALARNPLGLAPDLSYMKKLERLELSGCQLRSVPSGLFDLEALRLADLSDNQISELPAEMFEVADTQEVIYNFYDNPLDEISIERISRYDQLSGWDRQVEIQYGAEPDSQSDTDYSSSDSSDESGIWSLDEL